MATKNAIMPDDLFLPQSARFMLLTRPLTNNDVRTLFDHVIAKSNGRVIGKEERATLESTGREYVRSFICFKLERPTVFAPASSLTERRYGFVMLIERRGYLVVFHHLANGLDSALKRINASIDRRALAHLWADKARYQRFSTRRMSLSRQELRGATFSAYDLETAFIPSLVTRSIVQNIGLFAVDYGNVSITPSTGRVRVLSKRVSVNELVPFIDVAIDGIESNTRSEFLSLFPTPIPVSALPPEVVPTGLLFDFPSITDLCDSDGVSLKINGHGSLDEVLRQLEEVLVVEPDGDNWLAYDNNRKRVATIKRLKNSFSVQCDLLKKVSVVSQDQEERLDSIIRQRKAFSISFNSPNYFYSNGILVHTDGFRNDVRQVRAFLRGHNAMLESRSEKGDNYDGNATRFDPTSIFGILETRLASDESCLVCTDLGTEWADYIGIKDNEITFYHCKHGRDTVGASSLHIVVAQAQKNLVHIGRRTEEILQELRKLRDNAYWRNTRIPRLVRPTGNWEEVERRVRAMLEQPAFVRWRVAIVVDMLSVGRFDEEAAQENMKPHFVQLVWLLSAFISSCRAWGAEPMIMCRP